MQTQPENKSLKETYNNSKRAQEVNDNTAFEKYASQCKIKPYPEPMGPMASEVIPGGSLPDTPVIQHKKEEEPLQCAGSIPSHTMNIAKDTTPIQMRLMDNANQPYQKDQIRGLIESLNIVNKRYSNQIWRMAISDKDYPITTLGINLNNKAQRMGFDQVAHGNLAAKLRSMGPALGAAAPIDFGKLQPNPWSDAPMAPGEKGFAPAISDGEAVPPSSTDVPGRRFDTDDDNRLLNEFASKVRSAHGSPHLAITLYAGKIIMAGNSGQVMDMKMAQQIKGLFRYQFASHGRFRNMRIAFRNLGGSRDHQLHGEMEIIQSVINRARKQARNSESSPESVTLGGNKLDCIKCHAAMIAFNNTIGQEIAVTLVSNGHSGMDVDTWQMPDWLCKHNNARIEFENSYKHLLEINKGDAPPHFDD